MHLKEIRLRDFRNYAALDAGFEPGFHLFTGDNGQGKSNLLEAIYLLSTLKSFRGVPNMQMVRTGQRGYFASGVVIGERENQVRTYWSSRERNLVLNGRRISRMEDFYGTIRAVIFCTEDILLVKGSPAYRRRYMDFLLAQTDPLYLNILQRYGKALRARNAILKHYTVDSGLLESFTHELVVTGEEITRKRTTLVQTMTPLIQENYSSIAGESPEKVRCYYQPNLVGPMSTLLAQTRQRELSQHYTLVGPHRDELGLLMNGEPVDKYASEGQKRTWALALKMTQTQFLSQAHGVLPILLIDDVMGELDARRRQAFLPLLNQVTAGRGQMFMTCTEKNWPRELGVPMCEWKISNGHLFADRG